MKNIYRYTSLLFVSMILSLGTVSAQSNPTDNISIMVITPEEGDGISLEASNSLKNKIGQIVSAAGFQNFDSYSQFCVLVKIDVDEKYVVAAAPVKHAQVLTFNFYIVDQLNKTVFASTSMIAKGVGDNETKAYINGIKQFKEKSPEMISFVNDGKEKIIKYYTENCDKIIAKANSLAQQKEYGEALFLLMQIPDACTECHAKAMKETEKIFKLYMDEMCRRNLAAAKMAWYANQNRDAAEEAGTYLAQIYPDAACYGEVEKLYKEIKARIGDEWDFEKKMWNDSVSLESQHIKATRDIGVAWGTHQKPTTYAPAWVR